MREHSTTVMEKEVEVFKTGVQNLQEVQRLTELLIFTYPDARVTFDVEDCDKILRIEGGNVTADHVEHLLRQEGVYCQVLE